MSVIDILNDKFQTYINDKIINCIVPSYIEENINPKFKLRPYQIEAQGAFKYYIEEYKKIEKPVHLMFNLATGSGKTLLMASNILYLYEKGYRNFIFFVNSTNIIDKTKYNFLECDSNKYLFNNKIIINNKIVEIKEVNNLEEADKDSINMLFTTIQGLHYKLNTPTEGSVTYEDFKHEKVVLLSDEAHHLNTLTKKKLNKTEEEEKNSWEYTVNRILHYNQGNILLEYTATAELNNELVNEKYKDKIIYKYDLKNFREDKYSKDVFVLQSDKNIKYRILQAVFLSEYRRKVAEKNKILLKPIILIKSSKIDESKKMLKNFIDWINLISLEDILALKVNEEDNIINRAFKFFEDEKIEIENLIIEIKHQFSEKKCIEINSNEESLDKQIIINSLEDSNNIYRVIFAVDKLNEGWDVLNLFDIVRVNDGRGSSKATIKEAQLIGRGARYYPFKIEFNQDKFKRKYDDCPENELRALEELHYHCINEPKYISELRRELKVNGIIDDEQKRIKVKLKLKENFKNSNLYNTGVIFSNRQEVNDNRDITSLKQFKVVENYEKIFACGVLKEENLLDEKNEISEMYNINIINISIDKIGRNIVKKAISENNFFNFNNLNKYLPNINSMVEFIEGKEYLGGINLTIKSDFKDIEQMDNLIILNILRDIFKDIEYKIKKNNIPYKGTKEFYTTKIKDIKFDKEVSFSIGSEKKETGKAMSVEDGSNLRLNLKNEDWYSYEENYGTSEEKELILFMKSIYDKLISIGYKEIYLIRNEKIIKLYNFDDEKVFEPDFLLCCKKKYDEDLKYYQIFIEPKGGQLLEVDKWKEDFLRRIENEYIAISSKEEDVVKAKNIIENEDDIVLDESHNYEVNNSLIIENENYKLIGLSFYNKENEKRFKEEFNEKLKIELIKKN